MLASRYLLFYNLIMTAGWTVVLLRLVHALLSGLPVYSLVERPLKIFQTGALLEVVHALTGLVRSSAPTTALQVASRLMLVWGVADPVARVRDNLSFTTMVLAWALTEIPRYFYFSVAAAGAVIPAWLTWLRYSTFIPLYPLGASSEAATLFAALPFIRDAHLFSVQMPNRFNFAFDYYYFSLCILFGYVPGLPFMYSHMMRQRRKYVGQPNPKSAKAE